MSSLELKSNTKEVRSISSVDSIENNVYIAIIANNGEGGYDIWATKLPLPGIVVVSYLGQCGAQYGAVMLLSWYSTRM